MIGTRSGRAARIFLSLCGWAAVVSTASCYQENPVGATDPSSDTGDRPTGDDGDPTVASMSMSVDDTTADDDATADDTTGSGSCAAVFDESVFGASCFQ